MPAEVKILERAEMYLRKLSCGVNPVTDESLAENDACRQERISKCLAYVSAYLQQKLVSEFGMQSGLVAKSPKQPKPRQNREFATAELVLSPEELSKFEISQVPLSLSNVIRRINALIPADSKMMPLMYADVAEILSQEGILLKEDNDKGKGSNLPTPRGEELGFSRAEAVVHGHNAIYTKCNVEAQKFILDNIQKCIAQANARLAKRKTASSETGSAKEKFHLSEDQIQNFPLEEAALPVSEIARRLNDLLVPGSNVEQLYYKKIRDWFVAKNYLEETKNVLGKVSFVPTEAGQEVGVVTEKRIGKNGEEYDAVLYKTSAQKLVLEHVNEFA